MKPFTRLVPAVLVLLLCAGMSELHAQGRTILSPRDSVTLSLDTNVVSVNYGRPSMRGRKIMGTLVPWRKVWRTGANEATHLKTNFDMKFGDAALLKGRYTLWTIPAEDRWVIIVNKQTGQWGTAYDERQDLARFEVKPERLPAVVDTFRIALQSAGPASGVLKLMWERTLVSIPFQKDEHLRPLSPTDSTAITLGSREVMIKYSRPFIRGRKIWGVVVPFDSVWRTGANAATLLTTTGDIAIGAVSVPKGSYTLYSVPSADGMMLIVSKKPAGFAQYDPQQDLARIPMKRGKAEGNIDPFRIWLVPRGPDGATLNLGWADRTYAVDIALR